MFSCVLYFVYKKTIETRVANKEGVIDMASEKEQDFKRIIRILMQLDEKSLLLIESGAKLLAARQQMDEGEGKSQVKQTA